MSYTKQDAVLLQVLINSDTSMTAYAISKETGIVTTQVTYRLQMLVRDGVVAMVVNDEVTRYKVHPVLETAEAMTAIAKLVGKISYIIDKYKDTTADGMKTIISFILEHTNFVEIYRTDEHADEKN